MWIEAKRIKGHTYLYLRWREAGEDGRQRTRSKYLGKAGNNWPVGTVQVPKQHEDNPMAWVQQQQQKQQRRRWPACVCCGSPAQTLHKGEPVCYRCKAYLIAHEDNCPD